jgi:hypothetical protein
MRKHTKFRDPKVLTDGEHIIRPAERSTAICGWVWIASANPWSVDCDETETQSSGQFIIKSGHVSRQAHTKTDEDSGSLAIANFRESYYTTSEWMFDSSAKACVLQVLAHCDLDAVSSRYRGWVVAGRARLPRVAGRFPSVFLFVHVHGEVWVGCPSLLEFPRSALC